VRSSLSAIYTTAAHSHKRPCTSANDKTQSRQGIENDLSDAALRKPFAWVAEILDCFSLLKTFVSEKVQGIDAPLGKTPA